MRNFFCILLDIAMRIIRVLTFDRKALHVHARKPYATRKSLLKNIRYLSMLGEDQIVPRTGPKETR